MFSRNLAVRGSRGISLFAGLFRKASGDNHGTGLALLLIFLLLAAGIVTGGWFDYRNNQRHYRTEVERQLSAVADLKVGELVQWRQERLGDGGILFKNASISGLVRRFFEKPEDADAERQIQIWLDKYRTSYGYDEVRLLDTQGVSRLSSPAGLRDVSSAIAKDISEVLRSGQVVFRDFYHSDDNEKIRLAIWVPILDESGANRPLGAFFLRIDPASRLYPLIKRWPTPSKTAETLLVRREGNETVFLNELRFRTNTALNLRAPLDRVEMPAVQATLGREGIVDGLDYRGVPVVAALHAVPNSPWALVARMDTAEVYAPMRERLWQIVVLIGALLLGAGASVGLVWRQQRVRFYRERAGAAEALREHAHQYRELFESGSDALLLISSEAGQVIDANRMASELYGYEREELLTKQTIDLSAEPEKTTSSTREAQSKPDQVFNIPLRLHRKKDGTVFPVEITARSLIREGQSVLLVSCRDITERKHAEEEHKLLQAQLTQAQKMEAVGRLAGGVAHDFNNLLMGIMGYAELCGKLVEPGHPILAYLGEITSAANRSAEITRQLLAFARKQTIAPRLLDLNAAVAGMLELLRRLIGEDVILAFLPGADLRPVRLDPSQLDQILANLCVNARDAIAGVGTITVETGNIILDADDCAGHAHRIPGAYALLAVSDDGCGMDAETLAQIFEPFFTTKELGRGTGLGLATVYGIVKQNNGFIYAYSNPGRGTTFKIYLPQVVAEAVETTAANTAEAPRGRAETILVAEDETLVRAICRRFLDALGYEVLEAETPEEALQMAERHQGDIHLLLTDVVMPGMDGRKLAERVSAVKPGLKVVFMSGYTADVIAQRGVLDEGVQFLSKPFTRAGLARKVREVLDGPRSS